MTTQKFNPVKEFGIFRDTFSRSLGQGIQTVIGGIYPLIDIYETDLAVIVRTAPLDGKLVNVEVTMEDDLLIIAGETLPEHEFPQEAFLQRERRFGKFSRSLRIPRQVKANDARAEFKKGILSITLPKIRHTQTEPEGKPTINES